VYEADYKLEDSILAKAASPFLLGLPSTTKGYFRSRNICRIMIMMAARRRSRLAAPAREKVAPTSSRLLMDL
jgi:hypothetical protein